MRNMIARKIFDRCKNNNSDFLITGDAGFGVWDDFQKELSNQYMNPGINEQVTIGLAAGMALSGHKVFIYNIVPFVLYRCYEQVRNDICYQELPVILIGIGCGLTYAPAGMTHYAIEDIALAKTCPNLDIFSPADPIEAALCFDYAYNSKKPSYIRVPKAGEPKLHNSDNFNINMPQTVKDGDDVLIVSHSAMVEECLNVAKLLEEKNISAKVISVPMLTTDKIDEIASFGKKVFVVEEHYEYGGLGTILSEQIDKKIHKIGLPNKFIHAIGNRDYMRQCFGIDAEAICTKIYDIVKYG